MDSKQIDVMVADALGDCGLKVSNRVAADFTGSVEDYVFCDASAVGEDKIFAGLRVSRDGSLEFLEEPTEGEIVVDGIALTSEASINKVREEVGMVFQRFNLFPHMTVLENIMLAPEYVRCKEAKKLKTGKSKKQIHEEVKNEAMELLKRIGLESKADVYPSTLSGGQKIKIQLMKILLHHPDILLLDEPSNDLDYESIQWLEHFIRTSDLAILYISHDVVLLKNTATSILHLEKITHQQRAVVHFVKEDYQTYIEQRKSAADKQLQIALKQRSEDKKRNAQLQQVKQKVQHQLRTTKLDTKGRLLAKKMANLKSREKRFEKERAQFAEMPQQEEAIGLKWQTVQAVPSSKPLIHLEKSQLKIADKILVEPLNFTFFGQEKVGIVGNNGIGKSLFLHKIAEMLQKRTDIQMKYMPQNYFEALDTTQSPVAYLLSQTKQDQATVMTYLGSLQFFVQEMQRPIAYLSGGQRAKLVILGLLLSQANVLLLDEPTRNLSPTSNQVLTQQLQQYNGALLTVSHDRYFLEQVCEKIYQLDKTGLQRIF